MKKKKEVYKIPPLTEGKENIIAALLSEYDIKTAEDIQEALKDLYWISKMYSPLS